MIKPLDINKIGQIENSFDFKDMHHKALVDLSEVLKPQPIAISFGETIYKNDMFPLPFGTYGNFSCIVGQSKSTKSFLKSLILGCSIGGNSINYASHIKAHNIQNKYIIDIDTEQSDYDSQRVFRRTIEMVGYMPDNYLTFALRDYDAQQRKGFLNWLIYHSPYKGKIGIISIDGIADLINDVNNIEESNELIQFVMKATKENNIHIISVLHLNFGTNKPRGHLGSELMRKAESIAVVKREDNLSIVTPDLSRNQPFQEFSFEIDKSDWLPRVVSINEKSFY